MIDKKANNIENIDFDLITLKDIALKHGIKISNMKPISKDALVEDSNLNISEIADSVFEMLEGEVSYPLELNLQLLLLQEI